jgi:MFS family permease
MSQIVSAFRGVFANRDLRRVELAAVGSELAAFSYFVVLAVVAYDASGTGGVGILMLTRMAAAAITTPFTSALADRFPRKRVMVASNLLAAALILAIAAAVSAGVGLVGLCALASIAAIVTSVFRPAQAALLPTLARTPEQLTAANAVSTTVEGVAIFLGPGIGGILLGLSGPTSVFGFAAAGLLWSAALVTFVHEAPHAPEPEPEAGPESRFREATAGIRTLASERALLAVVGVYAVQTIVAGALAVFNVVLALEVFDLGNAGVGYLDSAFGVGGIIGGILAAGLSGSRRLGAWFAVGAMVWGVGISLVGLSPTALIVFVVLAGVGAGNTVVDVAAITLIQRSAPAAVLARVFGVIESILLSGIGLGSILAPVLIAWLGARPAIVVTGLLLPLAVALLGRRILSLDAVGEELIPLVDLMRATSIFAPLPQATLEQVARRLEPMTVLAGKAVINQGDAGDLFYLIATGTALVSVDGEPRATIVAGDFFGEIALLRDTPRTATVTAETDMELLSLDRDQFLAAVTGHAQSVEEADLVVSQRLAALRQGVSAF